MNTEERALRDYQADPVGAARERKRTAQEGYERALVEYRAARERGDTVEETDGRERSAGVRYRAANPHGKAALAFFQVRKAELDGAELQLRWEQGRATERDQGDSDAADFAAEAGGEIPW